MKKSDIVSTKNASQNMNLTNKLLDLIINTNWFDKIYQLDQCKQYVTIELSYDLCVSLLMLQCNQQPDINKIDQLIRNIPCKDQDIEKWIIFDSIPDYNIESIRSILVSYELTTNKSLFWLLYDTVFKIRQIVQQIRNNTFTTIVDI